jgi:hypothetical protein
LINPMASLDLYIRKYGKREGRILYNAFHRAYKKKHARKINAARRKARRLKTNGLRRVIPS